MASRAYQPDQTQTPYKGWHSPQFAGRFQTDWLWVSDYAPQSPERQLEPPHLEARVVDLGERQKFKADYATWLEDSMFDSLPNMMREHHSFREIIQSGERVVPLIASELRRRPSFLFLALEDITGEDPVPDEARGNLKATVSAWLAWLRR